MLSGGLEIQAIRGVVWVRHDRQVGDAILTVARDCAEADARRGAKANSRTAQRRNSQDMKPKDMRLSPQTLLPGTLPVRPGICRRPCGRYQGVVAGRADWAKPAHAMAETRMMGVDEARGARLKGYLSLRDGPSRSSQNEVCILHTPQENANPELTQ